MENARIVAGAAAFLLAACSSNRPVASVAPAPAPPAPASVPADAAAPEELPSPSLPADERAKALLARMTLEEKIDYLGGDRNFFIRGIARLGIPEIKMSDGPAGCRNWGPSTAYPAPLATAATFDPAMTPAQALAADGNAFGATVEPTLMEWLQRALDDAHIDARAGEFLRVCLVLASLAGLAAYILTGAPLAALIGFLMGGMGYGLYLASKASKTLAAYEDDLPQVAPEEIDFL